VVKLGLIGRNPAEVVTPPKSISKEMRFYDENLVNQMLLAARGDRHEALYQLAITTGLRQGELLGLRWSDLDLGKRTLQVQRQLKRKFRKGDYFELLKTKAGRRTIILGAKTIEKLQEHWKRQNQERIFAGSRWQENDLIFPTPKGTPMDHSNLYRAFKGLIKKVGLPEIRFHDLRHTAASLMLNHGVPVIIVSRRLGHSKASITLDIYGHLVPEMQSEVAEMMDELITPVEIELHPTAPENASPQEKEEKYPHI
jgi:integrase